MSIGWSSDAKTAIQAGCPIKWNVDFVVDSGSTVDISSYTMHISEIENATSMIDKDWRTRPVIFTVANGDAYFTPNYMSGARGQIDNIYQVGHATEADPYDCHVELELEVTLPDGTTETNTYYKGKVYDLNFVESKNRVACEIVTKQKLLVALEKVCTFDDGDDVTFEIV